ncbi:cohesin domain-containing protein [Herbivorax sp. ANBcel31]|uniref:cohesin domain-containing protein n=1 Tax=Herbivorax sp. ANBcel31 TaxID=3069754 RepID=UPI0027B72964|nr:cohesin domain-containing protein [Herbivorax sp. ANBcel31]MDQ2087139.1 cohesin domain-containing protein [Herbivorax sp. ANBcel31]
MKKSNSMLVIIISVLCASVLMTNAVSNGITALRATFDIYVNDVQYKGENPPLVIDGRTYLPLRALGDVLGIDVNWNEELRRVEVERPDEEEVIQEDEIVQEDEVIPSASVGYDIIPEVRDVKFSQYDTIDLSLGDVSATKGSTVEIPVSLAYLPKGGIFRVDFELLYDRDILEIESVRAGKLLSEDGSGFSYNGRNGIVKISFDSFSARRQPIDSDGEFAVITAKIKENAPEGKTAIRLSHGEYFEDQYFDALSVWYIPGIITVK